MRGVLGLRLPARAAGTMRATLGRLRATTALRRFARSATITVDLNYQEPHATLATGRYINQEDKGDVVDTFEARSCAMRDGRALEEPATLESMGFALEVHPTAVGDFRDDGDVVATYYDEMRDLVKRASGASRVFVFDHTIRESGNTNLNAAAGGAAAPVPRVHCDCALQRLTAGVRVFLTLIPS